jgi:hypothetical protein
MNILDLAHSSCPSDQNLKDCLNTLERGASGLTDDLAGLMPVLRDLANTNPPELSNYWHPQSLQLEPDLVPAPAKPVEELLSAATISPTPKPTVPNTPTQRVSASQDPIFHLFPWIPTDETSSNDRPTTQGRSSPIADKNQLLQESLDKRIQSVHAVAKYIEKKIRTLYFKILDQMRNNNISTAIFGATPENKLETMQAMSQAISIIAAHCFKNSDTPFDSCYPTTDPEINKAIEKAVSQLKSLKQYAPQQWDINHFVQMAQEKYK